MKIKSVYCQCGLKRDFTAEDLAERWEIPANDEVWREYVFWRNYVEKKNRRQPRGERETDMTDNAKIIEVAALMLKLDGIDNIMDETFKGLRDEYEAVLAQLEPGEIVLVIAAGKLMSGKKYCISGGCEGLNDRLFSLAGDLGSTAEVVRIEEWGDRPALWLHPPVQH